jgi:hypothetical protein
LAAGLRRALSLVRFARETCRIAAISSDFSVECRLVSLQPGLRGGARWIRTLSASSNRDIVDGNGASYYTFGDRQRAELVSYYDQALAAFSSIAKISDPSTVVVQMNAFSEPRWQLPRYLKVMQQAGFAELRFPQLANSKDGRTWRSVPNRKWYASQQGLIESSKEVVLFHQLAV